MSGRNCHALRTTIAASWAVTFLLTLGLGGALAGTRLIAHFENDGIDDDWGRDLLREFYNSQNAGVDIDLYPNAPGVNNLRRFTLVDTLGNPAQINDYWGDLSTQPADFEIHKFAADGTGPGPGFLVGENRFAAFGSGWSLGAQEEVRDFHINFITVASEDDDLNYDPGDPRTADPALTNTSISAGAVQDWTNYDFLCFYLCINASDIPPQQFFSDFKIEVWEYWVDVTPGNPPTVTHNEREIYEVSLWDYLNANNMQPFTGWRHFRIPFSSFQKLANVGDSWRYNLTARQEALDAMNGTLDKDHIRAIIFRKDVTGIVDANGNPEPGNRITVAIDEIAVTGSNPLWDTADPVLRVNVPGATGSCDDNQNQGLCWAQLWPVATPQYNPDDPNDPDGYYQVRPFTNPATPAVGNVDILVTVRDWQQLWATFSAEVGNGAVVADNDISSEIVFVPQFQAPGTWVERWTAGPDFLRRKGTMQIPGPPVHHYLFYTDWRYDYTNGVVGERYLVRYNPAGVTPLARLAPSAFPYGGFLANYFREFGYAYGTLFILPRDDQGNIGQAQVIDVLFQQAAPQQLQYQRLMTGQP